jgi:hypothetical protein
MATSYIPNADADFSAWLSNFNSVAAANSVALGITAPQLTAIAAADNAFQDAYTTAVEPTTRTSATIAAKDTARVTAEQVVRPIATTVSANPAVSAELKTSLGVTVRKVSPSPTPVPVTQPVLSFVSLVNGVATFTARDQTTPDSKAKPYGVIAMELRYQFGVAAGVDPESAPNVTLVTKVPNSVSTAGQAGKVLTLFGRWVTRGGIGGQSSKGPWSAPVSSYVA